jgi:hypothetical protein
MTAVQPFKVATLVGEIAGRPVRAGLWVAEESLTIGSGNRRWGDASKVLEQLRAGGPADAVRAVFGVGIPNEYGRVATAPLTIRSGQVPKADILQAARDGRLALTTDTGVVHGFGKLEFIDLPGGMWQRPARMA